MREDFNAQEDFLNLQYHEARLRFPEKDYLFQRYMQCLEAEILILTKDKKLGEKYKITQDIVAEAYPDIRWGNRS